MTVDRETFSLGYTDLENALAELCGVEPAMIRVRFRKLRVRDFPDAVQLGRGTRLRYDLPRALALCAVFVLAGAGLPQLTASELVEATWPEWCRAVIVAAAEKGIVPRPAGMPADAGSEIVILPDGFTAGRPLQIAVNGRIAPPPGTPISCRLAADLRPVMDVLSSGPGGTAALSTAIVDLDGTFGWTCRERTFRGNVSEMPPKRGFLDDGPYFDRALAFVDACEGKPAGAVTLWRLGLCHSYLRDPAPIDGWKRDVGDGEVKPRLHHLLSFLAQENGISTDADYPRTMAIGVDVDVASSVRDMIAKAQRQRGLPAG